FSDISNRRIGWTDIVKENILNTHFFKPAYNAAEIHQILRNIPPNAKVSASDHVLAHLSQRKYIYFFPDVEDADYIAAFAFPDFYKLDDSAYNNRIEKYLFSPGWDIIGSSHRFVLLKKQTNHINVVNIYANSKDKVSADSITENLFNPSVNLLLDNY